MADDTVIRPFNDELFAEPEDRAALPYPGLRPFKKSESRFFYGRETQIAELVGILAKSTHFVTTIGPSGCGKSSLIQAGVLPALEFGLIAAAGQNWISAKMRPGNTPLAHLRDTLLEVTEGTEATALSNRDRGALRSMLTVGRKGLRRFLDRHPIPANHRLLLLIDQFEELFRYDLPQNEVKDFVRLLVDLFHEPVDEVFVILTMRTDYLGDCTRFRGLADVINRTFYLIPPLNTKELRSAIEAPAVEVGGHVEKALTAQLLADMNGSDDQLPLMQHALMWMWIRAKREIEGKEPESRDGIELTLTAYRSSEVGSLNNALSRHADHVVDKELGDKGRHNAELLFRQLVQRDENRYIRRPAKVGDIIDSTRPTPEAEPQLSLQALEPMVARLSRDDCAFIYAQTEGDIGDTSADLTELSTLDIGHEALIRQWESLNRWAKDETESGDKLREVVCEADQYDKKGRSQLLDRLALTSYRKIWEQTRALYAAHRRPSDAFPSRNWAQRHLHPLTARLGRTERELYESGIAFWNKSKWRRIYRAVLAVGLAVGLPILALLVNAGYSEDRKIDRLSEALEKLLDTGLDYYRFQDAAGFRQLARSVDDITMQTDEITFGKLWRSQDIADSRRVANDLKGIYYDLADLHGIAGEHWKSPPRRRWPHVPIGDAVHFEHDALGHCLGAIDAVGQLAVTCDSEDPPPSKLLSTAGPKKPAMNPGCFSSNPPQGCHPDAVQVSIRAARVAFRASDDKLVVVAPDRSLHVCELTTGERPQLDCEAPSDTRASAVLKEKGTRLRAVAFDKAGQSLAVVSRTVEEDRDNQGRAQGDFAAAMWGGKLFRVDLLDLASLDRVRQRWFLLDTTHCGYPGDLLDVRLQTPPALDSTHLLSVAFNSSTMCQWALGPNGLVEQPATMPDPVAPKSVAQLPHPGTPIRIAVSPSGDRAVAGGNNRPLSFFATVCDEEGFCENRPTSTRIVYSHGLNGLEFFDDDLVLASDNQANLYLIRFDASTVTKLNLPREFPNPILLFAVDRENEMIYGVSSSPAGDIVRWDMGASRASRVVVTSDEEGARNTRITQQRKKWRRLIDKLASRDQGLLAMVRQMPEKRYPDEFETEVKTLIDRHRKGPSEPAVWHELPNGRQLIAVYERNMPEVFNIKPAKRVTFLRMESAVGAVVETSSLWCRRPEAKDTSRAGVPRGCWLILELRLGESESRKLVYHFPRIQQAPDQDPSPDD